MATASTPSKDPPTNEPLIDENDEAISLDSNQSTGRSKSVIVVPEKNQFPVLIGNKSLI